MPASSGRAMMYEYGGDASSSSSSAVAVKGMRRWSVLTVSVVVGKRIGC